MTDSQDELITIGVLARASGLTPSALRFYDDCGLLVPARVDSASGYRYYRESQGERAVLIRRLRGIEVPLEAVAGILAGDRTEAERLLDAHVSNLEQRAVEAAAVAGAIKQALRSAGQTVLSGATLAEAIEQVRSATAHDGEIPVLTGIFVEVGANSVTLTATDRYRLSTRSFVPSRTDGEWSLVVDAEDLATVGSWLRHVDEVAVAPSGAELVLSGSGGERRCRAITETFPDYRAVVTALAPVRTRVLVARDALLAVSSDATITLAIDPTGLRVLQSGQVQRVPATVTGSNIELAFAATTLWPAVHGAVGPEIMLDITAADQPVVIRSATDGDLTTLAMPTAIPANTKEDIA